MRGGRITKRWVYSVCLTMVLVSNSLLAGAPSSQEKINTLQIAAAEMKHRIKYTNYHVIGTCIWIKEGYPPRAYTTLEVSEYKPDLVVTVYNQYGDDPWREASLLDTTLESVNRGVDSAVTGYPIGEGNSATSMAHMSYSNLRSKLVDVIGSPLNTLALVLPQLNSDTTPLFRYYQSDRDTLGRIGIAEALRPETYNPFGQPIGENMLNHWAFEFPRDMKVNVDNDFKAGIVVALRAADIVTNKNTFHTLVKSTQDSCGENCAVSSVKENTVAKLDTKTGTFEESQFNEKNPPESLWQEVYPDNKAIQPGQNDALILSTLGSEEEIKTDGNLVFVVWRHYEGCVQHSGNLIFKTKEIKDTVKR